MMLAIRFTEKNSVSYTTQAEPEPSPDEIVVTVKASGICHTDFEVLKANYGSSAFPVVPGHEYAGIIEKVGADVTTVKVGDRVVIDPNIECGNCRACKRGWAHLCETLGAYGVTHDGGFAEKSVVNANAVHLIGDMSFSQAALAEPMACVLNGVDSVWDNFIDDVLIFGAGPMGILMGIALQMRGVKHISLCDIDDTRLGLAASFGFSTTTTTDVAKWHQRADLVVDATGVPAVAENLVNYAANGGKVLYFGICPSDARVTVSPFEVFRRQLTLAGSHSMNHNIPQALAVLTEYGPDIERIISHRLSLEEISKIFETSPPKGSLKIQANFEDV